MGFDLGLNITIYLSMVQNLHDTNTAVQLEW